MKYLAVAAALLASTALFAPAAHAVPIAPNSELSIAGPDTFDLTTITFTGPASVGGTSGSFTELASCLACVTMAPTLTASTSGNLFSIIDGVDTASLSILPPSVFTFGGTPALPSLTVTGHGTLNLTGFDATPGVYELTTQGPFSTHVTFSATTVPVPEPGSFGVLALAGLGLVLMRKLRRQ